MKKLSLLWLGVLSACGGQGSSLGSDTNIAPGSTNPITELPSNPVVTPTPTPTPSFSVDVIQWGTGSEQFGHLYRSTQESTYDPALVIVMIHGGCWYSSWELSLQARLSQALASKGFVVWNIEYRRMGNDGDWPNMFQDVANATDFLADIAGSYNLDLQNVVSMGHSAGGHLALWLLGREGIPEGSDVYNAVEVPVVGAVSHAGIPDLESGACGEVSLDIVGVNDIGQAELDVRLDDASPIRMLPTGKASVLVTGSFDQIVLSEESSMYAEAARALGDNAFHMDIDGANHFYFIDPLRFDIDMVQRHVLSLIED